MAELSAAPARFLFQWGGLLAALKLRSSSTKLRRRQVASESYSSPHLHLARILASRFVGSGIASLLSLCSYLIIPNRYDERGCFHGRVCSDEPPSHRLAGVGVKARRSHCDARSAGADLP
jgi:hypothetical protein